MEQSVTGIQDSFVAFPIEKLVDNTITDFDLFINISNHIILYGALGYKWEKSELDSLLSQGHREFFIRPEDQAKVKMYHELNRLPVIEKNLAPKERKSKSTKKMRLETFLFMPRHCHRQLLAS